jgi:hypothetical protein
MSMLCILFGLVLHLCIRFLYATKEHSTQSTVPIVLVDAFLRHS